MNRVAQCGLALFDEFIYRSGGCRCDVINLFGDNPLRFRMENMWLVDCVERKIQSESHCTYRIQIANGKLLLSGSPVPPPYRQCRRYNGWKPSPPVDSFKFVQHGGILSRVASRKIPEVISPHFVAMKIPVSTIPTNARMLP